jgi:hypothetical protein
VIISRPVLVDVSAHGLTIDQNCPPASTICLTTVGGANGFQHLEQFASVSPRAARLLVINLAATAAAKQRVGRLALSADTSVAERASLRYGLQSYLMEIVTN